MMSGSLIVNADDFGWTDGHNQAVDLAHKDGVLNSASLMATGWAFEQAAAIARSSPQLRVGAHLLLNEGQPLCPPAQLPTFVRSDGTFHDSPVRLASAWFAGKLATSEILPEWRKQVEKILESIGKVSHLDSHKHVHLFPPALDAIIAISTEYGVPYVRLPLESGPFGWIKRPPSGMVLWALALLARAKLRRTGLNFADRFLGFSHSGNMVHSRLADAIRQAQGGGVTEIMVHPAVETEHLLDLRRRYRWAARYKFEEELEALIALR